MFLPKPPSFILNPHARPRGHVSRHATENSVQLFFPPPFPQFRFRNLQGSPTRPVLFTAVYQDHPLRGSHACLTPFQFYHLHYCPCNALRPGSVTLTESFFFPLRLPPLSFLHDYFHNPFSPSKIRPCRYPIYLRKARTPFHYIIDTLSPALDIQLISSSVACSEALFPTFLQV